MSTTQSKSCEQCKFCILDDYGYSNYTVEGTYVFCAKKLHPEDGFDKFYGEDKRLFFAEQCPGFDAGECIRMDVDREDLPDLTIEQQAIWDAWNAKE